MRIRSVRHGRQLSQILVRFAAPPESDPFAFWVTSEKLLQVAPSLEATAAYGSNEESSNSHTASTLYALREGTVLGFRCCRDTSVDCTAFRAL